MWDVSGCRLSSAYTAGANTLSMFWPFGAVHGREQHLQCVTVQGPCKMIIKSISIASPYMHCPVDLEQRVVLASIIPQD